MSTSKSIATIFTVFVCATALTLDASAQSRGGGGHGGASGGGRAPSGGASMGQAAPRGGAVVAGPRGAVVAGPRGAAVVGRPGYPYYGYGRYPYYGYGRYPYYGYPYYGYPGFSIGFGFGYPYAYGYYGYGYPYYAGYPAGYAAPGYIAPGYAAYGGIRIQGAAPDAEVYVDGNFAGAVDNYNGTFDRLDLGPGAHEIEIRTSGGTPLKYDVSVNAGQTVTIHANAK